MVKKKKIKKHEMILGEIDRMYKADELHCNLNCCDPTDFMRGKVNVYQDLTNFINKL